MSEHSIPDMLHDYADGAAPEKWVLEQIDKRIAAAHARGVREGLERAVGYLDGCIEPFSPCPDECERQVNRAMKNALGGLRRRAAERERGGGS